VVVREPTAEAPAGSVVFSVEFEGGRSTVVQPPLPVDSVSIMKKTSASAKKSAKKTTVKKPAKATRRILGNGGKKS
jgi:hypothetical protein